MRRARKTYMNPAIPSAAAISTRTVRSALRRIDSSFTASPAATTSNRSATHGAALCRCADRIPRLDHGLASLVRGRSLPGSREAVLNERASPPEGRGREAEHPPEGPVEVRSVRKAGSVGGLGGRRTPCHLAQGVTQPQPEEVAADREPALRSEG